MSLRLLAALSLSAVAAPALSQPALPGSDAITQQVVSTSYALSAPAGSDLARGHAALLEGRYETARLLLDPLADGAMSPTVQLLAGYANLGTGRSGKAARLFERSLAADRTNPFALHGLGLAKIAAGRDAGAELAALEAARDACKSGCRTAQDLDQAIASLRRAIG